MYEAEEDWQRVVQDLRYVRRLSPWTDYCSLSVFDGSHCVMVVDDFVPYRDFLLRPFHLRFQRSRLNYLGLVLDCYPAKHKVDRGVASFKMIWRSKYFRGENLFFTLRPHSIFVLIPTETSIVPGPFPLPRNGKSKVPLPIDRPAGSTVQAASNFYFGAAESRRRRSRTRGGRSSDPRPDIPRPNMDIYQDVFDAKFTDTGPPEFSGFRSMPLFIVGKASVNTPGFRHIKKNMLPDNPFSYSRVRYRDNPAYLTITTSSGSTRYYYGSTSYTYFTPAPAPVFDSALYNKVLAKLAKRTDADISANLAQDVVQFKQLNNLIGGSAQKIAKAIEQVRQKNFRGAAKALSSDSKVQSSMIARTNKRHDAATNWLQMQYGWKILLKEIEDLMRILADSIKDNPPVRRETSYGRSDSGRIEMQGPFISGSTRRFPMDISEINSVKIVLKYSLTNKQIAYAQQLGFLNPVNLAWEVIPYSFVADWFIPIGPYLETLSSFQGMTLRGGSVTRVNRQWVNASFTDFSDPGSGTTFAGGGSYEREYFSIQRSPLGDFPRAELPLPKNPISVEHSLNALALIQVAFGKKYSS